MVANSYSGEKRPFQQTCFPRGDQEVMLQSICRQGRWKHTPSAVSPADPKIVTAL